MSNKATFIALAAGAAALVALRLYDKKAFDSFLHGAVDVAVAVGEASKQANQDSFFQQRYEAYVEELKSLQERDKSIFGQQRRSRANGCLVTFYHQRTEQSERDLVAAIERYRNDVNFWS
jgi:hypothetical protein